MYEFWIAIVHNWALISILSTLALLIVVPALVVRKYVRICLNILRDTEPPLAVAQTRFVPMAGIDVDFYAADGVRLRGTLIRGNPTGGDHWSDRAWNAAAETDADADGRVTTTASNSAAGAPRGLIVFAPEFKSSRQSVARYARPLWEAGYDLFAFDFRGQGESAMAADDYQPRQWASDREVDDMDAAIAWCESWLTEQGRPAELGVLGISRGAGAAILAAEHRPSVRAIVGDGTFSSDCTLEHLMRKWAKIFASVRLVYENHPPEFWRFLRWCVFASARRHFKCEFPSVRKAVQRMVPRPLLLIHGARDGYIPVDQSRLLYALAPQPKYLWIVPRAKHNQSVDVAAPEYARRTVHFFDRYLVGLDADDNIYHRCRLEEIARSEQAYQRISVDEDGIMRRDDAGRRLRGAIRGRRVAAKRESEAYESRSNEN